MVMRGVLVFCLKLPDTLCSAAISRKFLLGISIRTRVTFATLATSDTLPKRVYGTILVMHPDDVIAQIWFDNIAPLAPSAWMCTVCLSRSWRNLMLERYGTLACLKHTFSLLGSYEGVSGVLAIDTHDLLHRAFWAQGAAHYWAPRALSYLERAGSCFGIKLDYGLT